MPPVPILKASSRTILVVRDLLFVKLETCNMKPVVHNPSPALVDSHGRPIADLRVAITDRCNYKCVYCRTGNDGAQYADLPIEDYLRMVRVLVSLGIEKVRITGGEPLLRK